MQNSVRAHNKVVFQSKADHPRTGNIDMLFRSGDLDLDPMTLIYDLYIDIPKMCLHIKNEYSSSKDSKSRGHGVLIIFIHQKQHPVA